MYGVVILNGRTIDEIMTRWERSFIKGFVQSKG